LYFRQQADDSDIIFQCDDGAGGVATYFFLDGGNTFTNFQLNARWVDNAKAQFGNSGDLNIFHDSANSYLENKVGNLILRQEANDADIIFKSDDGSGGDTEYFRVDGGLERNIFSKSLRLLDDVQLDIGSSDDFRIKHTSANNATFIQNFVGDLNIEQYTDDADIIFKSDDGSGGGWKLYTNWR